APYRLVRQCPGAQRRGAGLSSVRSGGDPGVDVLRDRRHRQVTGQRTPRLRITDQPPGGSSTAALAGSGSPPSLAVELEIRPPGRILRPLIRLPVAATPRRRLLPSLLPGAAGGESGRGFRTPRAVVPVVVVPGVTTSSSTIRRAIARVVVPRTVRPRIIPVRAGPLHGRPAILDLALVGGSVSMSGYPALRELKLPAVLTGSDRCPPPPGRELRLLRPAPPIDFGGRPSGRGWLPSL